MRNGLFVLVLVVVLTTIFGLYRRATDGRLREHRPARGATAVAAAALDGRPVPLPDDAPEVGLDDAGASPDRLTAGDIGTELGERATLVQLSTAFCQPCRATRRTLTDVAEMLDGVAAVDVDAESHLDLVRRLGVTRTPTVFVLDAQGVIVRRAVGAPRRADVVAALGEVL